MNTTSQTVETPAQRLARRATAVGVGFLLLIPAWQIGLRVAVLGLDAPVAPVVAMASAILVSIAAAWIVSRRLRGRDGQGANGRAA